MSNFDSFEETEPFYPPDSSKKRKIKKDNHFIGYTYKKEEENQQTSLATALQELEAIRSSLPKPKPTSAQPHQKRYMMESDELYKSSY